MIQGFFHLRSLQTTALRCSHNHPYLGFRVPIRWQAGYATDAPGKVGKVPRENIDRTLKSEATLRTHLFTEAHRQIKIWT